MTIANDDAGAAGAAFATEELRLAMVQPAAAVIVSGGKNYRFLPIAYTAQAVIPLLEVAA
ncbi:hypothetical protein [Sphingomonas yabuuchiae]|uniref:Uncharacterized protein n=1 Tax=Sphingomonas yabuuchiae TaxID=172044 RepID=A0AA41DA24_9SPHN|nr:hypothetical protein [Sphingomonas yabuuchiae]MBB4611671.1 hypothetical protein [Sphingomonas yabuuchiae]MBN3556693.1 hypothetical protein [Sphingomonas yabuuchiae]